MESKDTTKEENLRILLKNFVESRDDIIVAFLYSNQGLLMTKYGKLDSTAKDEKETEDVYGAFTALVENLLNKISLEYEIGHYGTGSFETEDNRIIYLEAGSDAILLLICDYEINLNKLFPIAYLVVEKIAQLLEESFDFKFNTLEIPDLNIHETFSLGLDKFSTNESKTIINGVTTAHQFRKPDKIEKLFKLVVLGSAAVGKTTLVNLIQLV